MNFTSSVKSVGGYLKGIGQAAFKGENAGNAAYSAMNAIKEQNKKHVMHLGIGAAGASGLAGLTYIKGKQDGMKKSASSKFEKIDEYLKSLPEDSKKKLLKKVKIKRTNLYSEKGK